jgi:hypothetical protein
MGMPIPGRPEEEVTRILWIANAALPNLERMYHMTQFAANLNNATPGLTLALPPTDTRLRPDQRLLELTEYDAADNEKRRLESSHVAGCTSRRSRPTRRVGSRLG